MLRVTPSSIVQWSLLATFVVISKVVFDRIHLTSQIVVDEEFHLPLGQAYCKYEFSKWHPKVTTFPGLYLLSSLLLGAFNLCSTYWLRSTSLLFSFINIVLFKHLLDVNNRNPSWSNIVSSVNLALLPPLYFFSHLYYTDVSSLTMILALFLLYQRGNHYFASIFGMFAVLFRQTNIIWVGMVFACFVLQELNVIRHQSRTSKNVGVSTEDLIQLLKDFRSDFWMVVKGTNLNFWLNSLSYGLVLLCFILFVYINGSIVVGDKSAHEATIHVPQLFYFSVFCLFFAWPHFVGEIFCFFNFIAKHKIITLIATICCCFIVHYNTLVHPYMLADNRHYVFYIWNRFYGKYFLFRYLMIPVYLFSWFVIIKKMIDKRDVTFLLLFIPCTSMVLMTQKLLEFRYFFIPFVLFRIRLKNTSIRSLFFEFITHCVLNICTFYLFFTKTIEWSNFDHPQRLIW